jgi:sugar lactone lactonase YvrE
MQRTESPNTLLTRLAFLVLAVLSLSLLTAGASAVNAQSRPLGDSKVFAPFPADPGFPESIAVNGDRVYVAGPAQFGSFVQPKVIAYDLNTGAQVAVYPILGQNPFAPQAGTGIAFDKKDFLYVGDLQQGVIRFDVDLGPGAPQEEYATALPDIPTCAAALPGATCSPTAIDQPPLINDLVFDKDGNLYISDSMQATIWRVPTGGGAPQVWFQSATFDTPFGPNGMRFDPKGKRLYVAITFDNFGGSIYSLPAVSQPTESDLSLFRHYAGEGPDGIAFGKSGKLYVALAASNQISVLGPDGTEEARYSGPASNPGGALDPLPYANPSAFAFNDKTRSLLITNHAIFFPAPADAFFAVIDVYVGDKGDKLATPNIK